MRLRVYDNGGETVDRYTVLFMEWKELEPNTYTALGMSEDPFHPQGFGQHCIAEPGTHLGKRIKFKDLPKDCRRLVIQDIRGDK